MTAGDVLLAARDRHPAFDRHRTPDAVALRFLSDYARELHGKVAAIDESLLAEEGVTATLPLADHEAGIPLPANRYLAGVTGRMQGWSVDEPRTFPIVCIPWARRFDRDVPRGAAWEHGDVLYLRSPASLWRSVDQVAVSLVPIPQPLTDLNSALALPETARRACVEHTALAMARRGHTDPALPVIDVAGFITIARTAEADYLADVANRLTGIPSSVRDVWH